MTIYPGVPSLLIPAQAAILPTLMRADAMPLPGYNTSQAQWGIFKNKQPVIVPDNIVGFDFRKDFHISNYPQEAGAFQSYNKVDIPFDARVTMSKGGSIEARQAFLSEVEMIAKSIELYDVVTPEKVYANCNIAHVDYSRTSTNGATLLTVIIWLIAVPVTASQTLSNTAAPSGANPATVGTVQAQTPTASQLPN